MRLIADFVLNQELSRLASYPFYLNSFGGLCSKEHSKDNEGTLKQLGKVKLS